MYRLVTIAVILLICSLVLYFPVKHQDTVSTSPAWFTPDEVNNQLLPRTSSSFIAWGDPNGDGFPDLWSGNHGKPNLFINNNGRLEDATAEWGVIREGDTHGVAWADYNNDGLQDLVELLGGARGRSTGGENRLYQNQGGYFKNVARSARIELGPMRSRVPLWFDFNTDNEIDLLLTAAARQGFEAAIYRQKNGIFSLASEEYDFNIKSDSGYAQLAYLGHGALSLVLHSYNYPGYIFQVKDDNLKPGLNPLPTKTGSVTDSFWGDLNNDLIDDLVVVQDWKRSEYIYENKTQLKAFLVKYPNAEKSQLEFSGPTDIEISVSPYAEIWWHPEVIFLGSRKLTKADLVKVEGRRELRFRASASNLTQKPTETNNTLRHLQVDYNPERHSWRISIHGKLHEDVNLIITANTPLIDPQISPPTGQQTVAPRLFLSSPLGYIKKDLPVINQACSGITGGDFDNDADQDLLLVCGTMLHNSKDILLENIGGGNFLRKENHLIGLASGVAETAATSDYNRDGCLDLVVSNGAGKKPFGEGPLQFFQGIDQGNHWLQVDLTPPKGIAFPYGAQLLVSTEERTQARTINGGIHGGAQDDQIVHYGLGNASIVKQIELRWPNGNSKRLNNIEVNQRIRVPAEFFD